MSGAEVLGVVGIIANIFQLIDFSVDIYERAKGFSEDVRDIPKSFRNTAEALPLVRHALQVAERRISEGGMDPRTSQELKEFLKGCERTLSELKEVFQKVLPEKGASKWVRGWKAVSSVGQDKKVEALDKSLQRYIDVLTLHFSAQTLSMTQLTQALASTSTLDTPIRNPLFIVRYEREENFIGREEIMLEMSKRFEQRIPRVALAGIGGVGKSRIAIEYCYQYREENPNSNIFWVHGGSRSRVVNAYYEIAEKINIPGFDESGADILKMVSDWLSDEKNGSWLMILDNADDAELWLTTSEERLINYLPRGKHGSTLITTRNTQLGKTISKKKPIEVPIFDSEDSIKLLQSKASEDDELTHEDAKEITDALGNLPLAITQAAAYLDQNEISVAEYLSLLNTSKTDAAALLLRESHDDGRDPDIQNSVFHTWKLSFDQISRQNPRAAEILSTMALLDRQAVPLDLLREKEEDVLKIREAIQKLKAFSLVIEQVKNEIFSMHRIVQLSVQWYMQSQHSLDRWKGAALNCVNTYVWAIDDTNDIRPINALLPHTQLVLSYEYKTDASKLHVSSLLEFLGEYNRSSLGRYKLAIQQLTEALRIRESIHGPDHEDTMVSTIDLAFVLWEDGEEDKAEEFYQRCLALSETRFPKHHIKYLVGLSDIMSSRERYEEAEELLQRALQKAIEGDGPESKDAAEAMLALARCHEMQFQYAEAENFERKAIQIAKRDDGNPQDLNRYMEALAKTLHQRGRYSEALEIRQRIFCFYNGSLGTHHPTTIIARSNLVEDLIATDQLVKAEELGRETLEFALSVLPPEHVSHLFIRELVAQSLARLDRIEEAVELYEENLRVRIKTVGTEEAWWFMYRLANLMIKHRRFEKAEELIRTWLEPGFYTMETRMQTVSLLKEVANGIEDSGDSGRAEVLYREVIALSTEIVGANNPKTIEAISSLAQYLGTRGEFEEAESLYRKAVVLTTNAANLNPGLKIGAMSSLAKYLGQSKGMLDEAQKIFSEVFNLEKQRISAKSKDQYRMSFVLDMRRYVDVLEENGKVTEAELVLDETVALFMEIKAEHTIPTEILGHPYIDTLSSLAVLATILSTRGRKVESKLFLTAALELRRKAVAANPREKLENQIRIAHIYLDLKEYENAEKIYEEIKPIQLDNLGDDLEEAVATFSDLGLICLDLRKYAEAETFHRRALSVKTQLSGQTHEETLEIMMDLEKVLRKQHKFAEVETLYKGVLDKRTETEGPFHEDTQLAMIDMIDAYRNSKKFDEATEMCQELIRIRTETLGPTHKKTLNSKFDFGLALYDQKRFEEAEKVHREVLEFTRETVGDDDPDDQDTLHDTLDTMEALGRDLRSLERYEEAETIQREILAISTEKLGVEDETTLATMYDLGKTLFTFNKKEEARELLQRALPFCIKVFGSKSRETRKVKRILGGEESLLTATELGLEKESDTEQDFSQSEESERSGEE